MNFMSPKKGLRRTTNFAISNGKAQIKYQIWVSGVTNFKYQIKLLIRFWFELKIHIFELKFARKFERKRVRIKLNWRTEQSFEVEFSWVADFEHYIGSLILTRFDAKNLNFGPRRGLQLNWLEKLYEISVYNIFSHRFLISHQICDPATIWVQKSKFWTQNRPKIEPA